MTKKIIFIVLFGSLCLLGQETDHDHSSHNHANSSYELGLSLGYSFLIDEEENSPSAHIHLLRKLGEDEILKMISLGAGFEYIFSEHLHYSIVGTFSINPYKALILDISPGILVTEHENETENQFVAHVELTYEFDWYGIGIGPVIGYGFSKEDNHVSVGVHFGLGF